MGIGERLKALARRKDAEGLDRDVGEEEDDSPAFDGEDDSGLADADSFDDAAPESGTSAYPPVEGDRRWVRYAAFGSVAVLIVAGLSAAVWLLPDATPDPRAGIPRFVMDLPPAAGPVESLTATTPTAEPAALTPASQPAGTSATPPGNEQAPPPPGSEATGAGTLVSPASAVAYAMLPARPAAKPLAEAPDPALIEPGRDGPLPKVDGKGRQPWRVYAAPTAAPAGWPRIGILVEGLGMSRVETEVAIDRLPAPVSLAFSPYAAELAIWTVRARQNGHETFLGLPLEPDRFPIRDPGPLALTTGVPVAENTKRLETVLGRMTGYVGVSSYMGERFLATAHQVRPLLQSLKSRGLAFVDASLDAGSIVDKAGRDAALPVAQARLRLDETPSRVAVDARLSELEAAARRDSRVLGVCRPYPATIERLAHWIRSLEAKNIALVPVTSLLEEAKTP